MFSQLHNVKHPQLYLMWIREKVDVASHHYAGAKPLTEMSGVDAWVCKESNWTPEINFTLCTNNQHWFL